MAQEEQSTVGFIGLGIMGKGMVRNLLTKLDPSLSFVVWNRSSEPSEELVNQFPGRVRIGASPADVVRQSAVTYSMLSTEEASVEVFDAPETGAIAGVSAGKIVVDCATLSPERMVDVEGRVAARGGHFLEAPVSGSKVPAETGQLIFLCGGSAEIFERVSPALDVMGKAKFLFGPVGKGSQVKLVVNMIMGSMMAGFSEGLALGDALSLPLDSLLQVLDLGAMSNPMFRGKGPAMIQDKFPTNFPLKHQQKDMRLALELAGQHGVALPTAHAANDLYKKAMDEQHRGDDDFSAVIKALGK